MNKFIAVLVVTGTLYGSENDNAFSLEKMFEQKLNNKVKEARIQV